MFAGTVQLQIQYVNIYYIYLDYCYTTNQVQDRTTKTKTRTTEMNYVSAFGIFIKLVFFPSRLISCMFIMFITVSMPEVIPVLMIS